MKKHNIDTSVQKPMSKAEKADAYALSDEKEINLEFRNERGFSAIPFSRGAKSILVPATQSRPSGFSLKCKTNVKQKVLIFDAFSAAAYRYYVLNECSTKAKKDFRHADSCWSFVETFDLRDNDISQVLKEYESYRVNNNKKLKTQSSGLREVKKIINDSLELAMFREAISEQDFNFLQKIGRTKVAPKDIPNAINLGAWFSAMTWLQRDDIEEIQTTAGKIKAKVGIGRDLYSRLASPKALMKSLDLATAISLINIQKAKDALIQQFERLTNDQKISISSIVNKPIQDIHERLHTAIKIQLNALLTSIDSYQSGNHDLDMALQFTTQGCVLEHCHVDFLTRLKNGDNILRNFNNGDSTFITNDSVPAFSREFLVELFNFSLKRDPQNISKPCCQAEFVLAAWMLAGQTVAAEDVTKITLADFRFLSRRSGAITHIETDYFKTRSGSFQYTGMLPTSYKTGQALLRFIEDRTMMKQKKLRIIGKLPSMSGVSSYTPFGHIVKLINSKNNLDSLTNVFEKTKTSLVFITALTKLVENVKYSSKLRLKFSSPFGLNHIKTSAVYSKSDTFNPTTLLNYNSHTDAVERDNYLTPHNLEWHNNCGRVTRAVMNDLTVNLYRASKQDRQVFNSEYTKVAEIIKQRAMDTLAVLKVVTEKEDGAVNEFGFVTESRMMEGELPDTILLEDSANTVLKLLHYRNEAQDKYKLLLASSPEHLFFTVLPQIEWIESLFDRKSFSKFAEGQALYRKYKDHLPPHFSSFIR